MDKDLTNSVQDNTQIFFNKEIGLSCSAYNTEKRTKEKRNT